MTNDEKEIRRKLAVLKRADEVEAEWQPIADISEAPDEPAFYLTGLIGWVQ